MMDMFLSVRLVVDTGMNALGWSRERAMDYMREHTLESEEQIRTESLRYSVDMPGQALAYKMGSRGFRELRGEGRECPRVKVRRAPVPRRGPHERVDADADARDACRSVDRAGSIGFEGLRVGPRGFSGFGLAFVDDLPAAAFGLGPVALPL